MENKFPGKDITEEDLSSKFPLAAKKYKNHTSKIKVNQTIFGGTLIPIQRDAPIAMHDNPAKFRYSHTLVSIAFSHRSHAGCEVAARCMWLDDCIDRTRPNGSDKTYKTMP